MLVGMKGYGGHGDPFADYMSVISRVGWVEQVRGHKDNL